MKKKVFVTGSAGLVGSRFVELNKKKYKLLTPEIDDLDLTEKEAVKRFINKEKPNVIVHFAAFTHVAEAENQKGNKNGTCWKVNVEGTRNLVEAIDPKKTHYIHISTNMVFSGSEDDPGPYIEDHPVETDPDKLTWYGFTKAEAEKVVLEGLGDQAAILRIIYPVRAKFDGKLDYLRGPLSKYKKGELYPLFDDQQVSITFIDEACTALGKIIEGEHHGIYHASSGDTTTPFELITTLVSRLGVDNGAVISSNIDDFLKNAGNSVRYSKFGGLKVEKTEDSLGIEYSSWREIVDELVEQGV